MLGRLKKDIMIFTTRSNCLQAEIDEILNVNKIATDKY